MLQKHGDLNHINIQRGLMCNQQLNQSHANNCENGLVRVRNYFIVSLVRKNDLLQSCHLPYSNSKGGSPQGNVTCPY